MGNLHTKFIAVLIIFFIVTLPVAANSSMFVGIPVNTVGGEEFCDNSGECPNSYYCDLREDGLINDKCCLENSYYDVSNDKCYVRCTDESCEFIETPDGKEIENIFEKWIWEDEKSEKSVIEDDSIFEPEVFEWSNEPACNYGLCIDGDSDCDGELNLGCGTESCEPEIEFCNRKDDDCDGVIDDGCKSLCNLCGKDKKWYTFGFRNKCDEEECKSLGPDCVFKREGLNSCINDPGLNPANCISEVCNQIDDDCDGIVDGGGVCDIKPSKDEQEEVAKKLNELVGKTCEFEDDCEFLSCKKSEWFMGKGICCFPTQKNKAGRCISTTISVGEKCSEDKECESGYCSKGINSYGKRLLGKLTPWEEKDGICCPTGTDYDSKKKECIDGGTFAEEDTKYYCREKFERGFVCEDEEGHCESDEQCMQGSYCTKAKGRTFPNMCCPKGTYFDEEDTWKCIPTNYDTCYDSEKPKLTKWECYSRGAKCSYDEKYKSCYERQTFEHNDGSCHDDNECYANGEQLYCSTYEEKGVCCYPWETYNSKTGKCMISCSDEFCDTDTDYYDSKIEVRYGSNPIIEEDTPWLRILTNRCDGPFEYKAYIYAAGNYGVIFQMGDSLSAGLSTSLAELLTGNFKDSWAGLKSNIGGFCGGAVYGLVDDIHFIFLIIGGLGKGAEFLLDKTPKTPTELVEYNKLVIKTILKSPTYIYKSYKAIKERADELLERNPEMNSEAVEEYASAKDSSIRNDIMTVASDSAYSVDIGKLDECEQMTHTKTFTSGFFGGFFWEQVLLLGKVAQIFKGSAKLVVKVAGYTLELIDNPIGYGISKSVKHILNQNNIAKLTEKIGETNFQKIMKQGEKETANALEIANIIKGKAWDNINGKEFETILSNKLSFNKFLAENFGDNEKLLKSYLDKTSKFLESEAGQIIFSKGYGKNGWSDRLVWFILSSTEEMSESMQKQFFINVGDSFKGVSQNTIKSFGKQLDNLGERGIVTKTDILNLFSGKQLNSAVNAVSNKKELLKHLTETSIIKNLNEATCFIEGTSVLTISGLKAIEDVEVGESLVTSKGGFFQSNDVLKTFEHKTSSVVEIEIDGEIIITTKDHPFFVKGDKK